MLINLISRRNGVGLDRDIDIITEVLSPFHTIRFCEYRKKPDTTVPQADINLFVELVDAAYFNLARANIGVFNPEWYFWPQYLPKFNAIFCKTKSAITAFQTRNRKTKYISFTSQDCYRPEIKKDANKWLHVAGKSSQKGTEKLFETWTENPQFPHLTVVQEQCNAKKHAELPNLTHIAERLPEEELRVLQNRCSVHLCPSETEGFGHYIMEALSCKAVVITTNAPPMNELVTTDKGILCDWGNRTRQRFAYCYMVSTQSIGEAVNKVLRLDDTERERLGNNARDFFLQNDLLFRKLLPEAITNVELTKGIRYEKNTGKGCHNPTFVKPRIKTSKTIIDNRNRNNP